MGDGKTGGHPLAVFKDIMEAVEKVSAAIQQILQYYSQESFDEIRRT